MVLQKGSAVLSSLSCTVPLYYADRESRALVALVDVYDAIFCRRRCGGNVRSGSDAWPDLVHAYVERALVDSHIVLDGVHYFARARLSDCLRKAVGAVQRRRHALYSAPAPAEAAAAVAAAAAATAAAAAAASTSDFRAPSSTTDAKRAQHAPQVAVATTTVAVATATRKRAREVEVASAWRNNDATLVVEMFHGTAAVRGGGGGGGGGGRCGVDRGAAVAFFETIVAKGVADKHERLLRAAAAIEARLGERSVVIVRADASAPQWYGPRAKTPFYCNASTRRKTNGSSGGGGGGEYRDRPGGDPHKALVTMLSIAAMEMCGGRESRVRRRDLCALNVDADFANSSRTCRALGLQPSNLYALTYDEVAHKAHVAKVRADNEIGVAIGGDLNVGLCRLLESDAEFDHVFADVMGGYSAERVLSVQQAAQLMRRGHVAALTVTVTNSRCDSARVAASYVGPLGSIDLVCSTVAAIGRHVVGAVVVVPYRQEAMHTTKMCAVVFVLLPCEATGDVAAAATSPPPPPFVVHLGDDDGDDDDGDDAASTTASGAGGSRGGRAAAAIDWHCMTSVDEVRTALSRRFIDVGGVGSADGDGDGEPDVRTWVRRLYANDRGQFEQRARTLRERWMRTEGVTEYYRLALLAMHTQMATIDAHARACSVGGLDVRRLAEVEVVDGNRVAHNVFCVAEEQLLAWADCLFRIGVDADERRHTVTWMCDEILERCKVRRARVPAKTMALAVAEADEYTSFRRRRRRRRRRECDDDDDNDDDDDVCDVGEMAIRAFVAGVDKA